MAPRIAELRKLDASALFQRLRDLAASERDMTSARPLGVIVDGDVIPRDDGSALEGNAASDGCGLRRPQRARLVPALPLRRFGRRR